MPFLQRMTPLRWFALFVALSFLSLLINYFRPAAENRPRNFSAQTLHLVLTPASALFTRTQDGFNDLWRHFTGATSPVLRGQLRRRWINKETMLLARISRLEAILKSAQLVHQTFPGISGQSLRAADIIGFSSAGSGTCVLDRGTMDSRGIQRGDVLLAHSAVVGRIIEAGPKTCTARLVSNPRMKIMAMMVRPTRTGELPVARLCMVVGIGHGKMRCELPHSVRSIAPQKGDLVALNDEGWPAAVHGAVIGQVTRVRASQVHQLRWVVHIKPRVDVQRIHQVVIFVGAKK